MREKSPDFIFGGVVRQSAHKHTTMGRGVGRGAAGTGRAAEEAGAAAVGLVLGDLGHCPLDFNLQR